MKLNDLIKKLQDIEEIYPDVIVDIDKIVMHISVKDEEPTIKFEKNIPKF